MTTLPLRLPPGADLRRAIEDAVRTLSTPSAFVLSGIGSLSRAALRFAAIDTVTSIDERLEILTLAGSVAADGAHLHASVSSATGTVLGGHVGYGCIVRTTAEILVAVLPDWTLSRVVDPATGYPELTIARREHG